MATPKELVDERLLELGLSKTAFAKKLGYSSYQGYYDLFSGNRTQLTDEKLAQIAEALDWPRDHFRNPGAAVRRTEYINRELAKFLESEIGREAHPETVRILRSMQWTGEFLPSARLYRDVALIMEARYTPAQILDAQHLEEMDAKIAREATPDETQPAKTAPRKR